MDVNQQQARELAAIYNSPADLLSALNDRLAQAQTIVVRLADLGWEISAAIPEQVERLGHPAEDEGVVYLANGMTAPRADGAVRIKAWDDAVAKALVSDDEPTRRWAAMRAAQPWVFIQDTLRVLGISGDQKRAIGTNCANARFCNAILGGTQKGFAWPAFRVFVDGEGVLRTGDEIPDAFAVNDDFTNLAGQVKTRGYWAADMATLADRSLLHFIKTSGGSVLPLPGGKPSTQPGKR